MLSRFEKIPNFQRPFFFPPAPAARAVFRQRPPSPPLCAQFQQHAKQIILKGRTHRRLKRTTQIAATVLCFSQKKNDEKKAKTRVLVLKWVFFDTPKKPHTNTAGKVNTLMPTTPPRWPTSFKQRWIWDVSAASHEAK